MLKLNKLTLLLVIFYNTKRMCVSEELNVENTYSLPSDYIYSPLRIYGYPYSDKLDSFIYFPTDGHYEVINYHKNPAPFKKLETQEISAQKFNSKIVAPSYYVVSSPSPFRKAESQKLNLPAVNEFVKSEKIIVSPLHEGPSFKKVESSGPQSIASNKIVKSGNGEVSTLSEGGKKYENSYHKKHGFKTSEGYNTDQKYSKGKKDSYEKKHDSGDESLEKKKKSSNYEDDEKSEHDNNHEEKENGEKYNSKKQHKKGSKAKGYHNVFMKDEYKKDHIFYDNADERGHYSKHGSEHTKYHNDEHEQKKGSHSNAGNESDSSKKQSLTDKKEYDVVDENYKKESKHKSHDGNSEEYKFDNGKTGYNVAITHTV